MQEEIKVPYREQIESFDLFYRPLWDWVRELLLDPNVVSKMEWHAQRQFRFDEANGKWKRFISEPWTANRWWKIQVSSTCYLDVYY